MPNLIGPSGFIVLRVLGGGGLFWFVRAVIRYQQGTWERIERADFLRLLACGTAGVAANQLLFFNGLNVTSPVNASLIMTVNPVLVLLISAGMLGTKITGRKMLGIAIGGAGAVALLILGAQQTSVHASWQGDLMVLINATSYGFYLVLVKPLMAKIQTTDGHFVRCFCLERCGYCPLEPNKLGRLIGRHLSLSIGRGWRM